MNAKSSPPASRDTPSYTLAEASRYLRLPPATLRSWAVGRAYPTASGSGRFPPMIRLAGANPALLSFSNLIEAHVLRSLRTDHGISVKDLRVALAYAEKSLRIDRLLLRPELLAGAGRLFLERYGALIDLSASGQIAMRAAFEEHLKRIDWDEARLPIRLYPYVAPFSSAPERPISIDPVVAFGRPVIARRGVSTASIAERIDAGEDVGEIAEDYDLSPTEIEQAVLYERAA